jgi:aminopeptidase N
MEDANETSLGTFKLWYKQAGTPTVKVTTQYDEAAKTFTLNCSQELPKTPDNDAEKLAQLIPISVGLVGPDGKDLVLTSVQEGSGPAVDIGKVTTHVLKLTDWNQTFTFKDVAVKPIPSVLRDFSAPVKLVIEQSDEELKFLLANDSDAFNRWEAGQRLVTGLIMKLLKDYQSGQEMQMDNTVTESFSKLLKDDSLDKEFRAYAMILPSTEEIADKIEKANPVDINEVRSFILKSMAAGMKDQLVEIYKTSDVKGPYKPDREGKSRRAIRNTALAYLGRIAENDAELKALLSTSFKESSNMTDQMAALGAICSTAGEERNNALQSFYTQWSEEPLVLLKWLTIQSESNIPGNLESVKQLLEHPSFDIKNPNNVYSLIGGFTRSAVNYHAEDGSGYEFIADIVMTLDKMNPQVAARMVGPFSKYKKYDDVRQGLIKKQLDRILKSNPCENVYEIVFKSL